MKRFRFTAVLMLASLMALPLVAQPAGPRPGGPGQGPGRGFMRTEDDIKRELDDLSKNLNLSSEQQKKLLDYEMEFYTRRQVEMERMRSNQGDFDREAMRERMQQVMEERNQKYEEVLTKEQLEKYNAIQEERRAQMRQQFQDGQQPTQQEQDRPARGRGRGN